MEKNDLKTQVIQKLSDQIKLRDDAEQRVTRLQQAVQDSEEKANGLREKIRGLNREISEGLAEGKGVDKKQATARTLRIELTDAENLAEQIKQESLPEALQKLKQAQGDLTVMLEAVLVDFRKDYEKRMNDHLNALMKIFDSWNEQTKVLFAELKVSFVSGSTSQVPKLYNPRFYRYITATGLGLEEKPVLTVDEKEAGPEVEARPVEEAVEGV